MAALQESVEAQASRGDNGEPADVHAMRPKRTAKKTAAKETPRKARKSA
ncbi:hypothetical protein ABZ177_28010 [Streptomyces sp. NPDC006284]